MASYPTSIFQLRDLENIKGQSYDAAKKTTIYAEDLTALGDEVAAIENYIQSDIEPEIENAKIEMLYGEKDSFVQTAPPNAVMAYATDTQQLYAWDTETWNVAALRLSHDNGNPDIGPAEYSGKRGYGDDYITDKNIGNLVLEGSARTVEGGLRIDHARTPSTLQIYRDGAWEDYVSFTALPALTHTQQNTQFYATIGNSLKTDGNGNPLIQQYQAAIGPLAPRLDLDGGTF